MGRPQERVVKPCSYCGKSISRSPSNFKTVLSFCDRACKDSAQSIDSGILQISSYKDGSAWYRHRAFRVYGKRCSVCGYDEDERMLDVDHIDGNRKNNSIENLQVLCVWHHAWKTRIGGVM